MPEQPQSGQPRQSQPSQGKEPQPQSAQNVQRTLAERREKFDREQVKKAPQESADAIFAVTVLSGAVMDPQLGDTETASVGEDGNEAMEFAVEVEFFGHRASKALEAAVVVVE